MNIAVYNKENPYLTIRLYTELKMEGVEDLSSYWNERYHPFDDGEDTGGWAMHITDAIAFHNHTGYTDEQVKLTEKNYSKVLDSILSHLNKTNEDNL